MTFQTTLAIPTHGRGTYLLDAEIERAVRESGVDTGLAHVFVRHTSASLVICENADPDVRHDLEAWLARLAPDGDPRYRHADEGPDDMAAHLRSILTKMDLMLPVREGRLATGRWQGVYLYEHRTHPHRREVIVTVMG